MEEEHKVSQQFNEEALRLIQIVEAWKTEHKDKIVWDKTKILEEVRQSSSGMFRFTFLVVAQKGQMESLDDDLTLLDSQIYDDSSFQIVCLDSLLF